MDNYLCGPELVDAVLEKLAACREHPMGKILHDLITERRELICTALADFGNTKPEANALTLLFSAGECIAPLGDGVRESLDQAYREHYSRRNMQSRVL